MEMHFYWILQTLVLKRQPAYLDNFLLNIFSQIDNNIFTNRPQTRFVWMRVKYTTLTRKKTNNDTFKNSWRPSVVLNNGPKNQHAKKILKGIALKKNLGVKFGFNLPFENNVNSISKKTSQKLPALYYFKGYIS